MACDCDLESTQFLKGFMNVLGAFPSALYHIFSCLFWFQNSNILLVFLASHPRSWVYASKLVKSGKMELIIRLNDYFLFHMKSWHTPLNTETNGEKMR